MLREGDLLARLGGEEFVVLLRDCPPSGAKECADRLRDATPDNMTCSAGYAMVQAGEETAHVIARADLALYQAKRGGRNCTRAAANELPQDLAVTAHSVRDAERKLA